MDDLLVINSSSLSWSPKCFLIVKICGHLSLYHIISRVFLLTYLVFPYCFSPLTEYLVITWMQLVQAGEIFDQSKIIRIDKGFGLLLEIPSSPTPTPAYVSVSLPGFNWVTWYRHFLPLCNFLDYKGKAAYIWLLAPNMVGNLMFMLMLKFFALFCRLFYIELIHIFLL